MTAKMMLLCVLSTFVFAACDSEIATDEKQAQLQAQALEQAHEQIGMPAVGNFSEKRLLKDIYEMRDKEIPTHTYIVNEMSGCLVYVGPSMGYGLPYATQFTAPTRYAYSHGAYVTVPQAEPNGLFMPSSAEGTWVQLKSPGEDKVQPVYIEPRVIVSPFRLTTAECKAADSAAPVTAAVVPAKK
jgi:hypothetical protein